MRSYQITQKSNYISQNKNVGINKKKQIENSKKATDDFFKTFIQTCVLAQWRYQVIARKYQKRNNRKPNKRDIFLLNTKKLCNATSNVFSDHLVNYLYDLCDLMLQMPEKPGIKHDKNYGTIQIVNNHTLDTKSMKRIKFLSKLYFIIRININLKETLIESINKMKELRQRKKYNK